MGNNSYQFIDIHYHANPDLYERRWDALSAGAICQSLKGAIFLTSHLGATSIQATLGQRLGYPIFPSLILNHVAGGIHYKTIVRALSEYQPLLPAKMLVHFPTITGRPFQSKLPRQLSHPQWALATQKSETLFNENQQLRQEVIDVLKMAADAPIVLTTGHASKEEIYSLIDAAIQYHVPALLLNQPAHPLVNLNAAQLNELAQNELVWVEQTFLTYALGHQKIEDFTEVLQTTPRLIYSSDLGQTSQPDIAQWLQESHTLFQQLHLSRQRQDELLHGHANALLGM